MSELLERGSQSAVPSGTGLGDVVPSEHVLPLPQGGPWYPCTPTKASGGGFDTSTRRYGGASALAKRMARRNGFGGSLSADENEQSVEDPNVIAALVGGVGGDKSQGVTNPTRALHPTSPVAPLSKAPKVPLSPSLVVGLIAAGFAAYVLLRKK